MLIVSTYKYSLLEVLNTDILYIFIYCMHVTLIVHAKLATEAQNAKQQYYKADDHTNSGHSLTKCMTALK